MSAILIAHSDQAVRKALIQTLKLVMPHDVFAESEGSDSAENALFQASPDGPARLKTLIDAMSKRQAQRTRPARIAIGTAVLDVNAREFLDADGRSVMLTEKEVDLLSYLFRRKNPATRDDLLRDVWGYAADVDTHTIETHIYRLRQKIEPDADRPQFLLTSKDGYGIAVAASTA